MKVCRSIPEVRKELANYRPNSEIALVPTMGALHNGHLSLIKAAKEKSDLTVASIFVNPTQFNNPEDLEKYPRNTNEDLDRLSSTKCDIVFLPEVQEIYPNTPEIKITFGSIANQLEGKFRPGHFNGVGLVVSKLFHIIQPTKAFFGQKDLQQFFLIKKLIHELSFPIDLHMVGTERESNGLAMSSRNLRLSDKEKNEAGLLYQALTEAKELLISNPITSAVKNRVKELFAESERLQLEYFEVVDTNDFKPLLKVLNKEETALCIAAEIAGVRLIDNLLLIS